MPTSLAMITRRFCLHFIAVIIAGSWSINASAADTPNEPTTLLTERGELILSDDLNAGPSQEWKANHGEWGAVDGVVQGQEVAADHHPAALRRLVKFQNVIIQYSFKLDGAKQTTLSINDETGHVCRVLIRPTGFIVQKDDHDHQGPDKFVVFNNIATPIKDGQWHTVVVEILGQEMLASIDGDKVGFGAHELIGVPKASFALGVTGQTASFKNLKVWQALPNKNWAETKARLASAAPSK